jgi:predicted RNase H-like HicB family nuclease
MMELEGRVWKDPVSSWWLVEVAFLAVLTQGRTRKEALKMVKDAVMELLKDSCEDRLSKQVRLNIYKKFLALFSIFHAQLLGRVYRHCPRHFA